MLPTLVIFSNGKSQNNTTNLPYYTLAGNINLPTFVNHEDWVAVLEPALCLDSAAVECLARILFTMKQAIDNGPDGAEQASRSLLIGIQSAYLYTDAHKAALKLYLLSLKGQLKPQDEPLQLINGAIKRGTSGS